MQILSEIYLALPNRTAGEFFRPLLYRLAYSRHGFPSPDRPEPDLRAMVRLDPR
jgi:hypothetical protein